MRKWWLEWEARSAGRRDGKSNVPGVSDTQPSEWERGLADRYKAYIRDKIEAPFHHEEAMLAPRFLGAKEDYRKSREYLERKEQELKRPVIIHLPRWAFFLMCAAIVLVEIPVNRRVFDIFGEASLFSYLLALLVSVILVIGADVVGKDTKTARFKAWHVGLIFCVAILLALLAYLRVEYLSDPSEQEVYLILQRIDLRALGVLFFMLNLLGFLLEIKLSYESRDADADYQEMARDYKKKRKVAEKLQQQRNQNLYRHKKDAEGYVKTAHYLINTYREENINSRENKTRPKIWDDRTPEVLISIDHFTFTLKDKDNDLS